VLLFLPYQHLEARVLSAVHAAGHPITLAQARVFARVDAAGSRLTTLARSAQVAKQTAGYLVDQLEEEAGSGSTLLSSNSVTTRGRRAHSSPGTRLRSHSSLRPRTGRRT